jgi:hypothetical protein
MHTVNIAAPLSRAFRLFRTMGLKQLVVVSGVAGCIACDHSPEQRLPPPHGRGLHASPTPPTRVGVPPCPCLGRFPRQVNDFHDCVGVISRHELSHEALVHKAEMVSGSRSRHYVALPEDSTPRQICLVTPV